MKAKLMPWLPACLAGLMAASSMATAQVTPTTPTKFGTRTLDASGASAGIVSTPKPSQVTTRVITFFTLSQSRQWKSSDGRSLVGKVVAFEDLVTTSTTGSPAAPAAAPAMPANPTVVRDGKVRLLVDGKPYEVPLDRLSEEDRKFVEALRTAVAPKKGG